MGSYRMCVCFTRRYRVAEAEPPADVKDAFRKYAEGAPHMSADQLRRFLAEVQLEDASAEAAERLLEVVQHRRHHLSKFRKHALSLDDFHHFLFSGDLNPPISDKVHHDMKAHLSHYFIYTGHNSYLTGNQISSHSSHVPVIKALRRGVRVVELDIWPNSSGDDVNVRHGRTFTTSVELLKCLKSIREHAFETSPYPVIITLEDHLTPVLQAKVAEMLTETFGEMLFFPETECRDELPSPEDLKYRIIISTKPPKPCPQPKMDDPCLKSPARFLKSPAKWLKTKPSEGADCEQEGNESESEMSDFSPECDENDKFAIDRSTSESKAYKRLIAIHSGKPKGGLKEQLKVDPVNVRRLSLNEQKFEKATSLHGTDVVRFTQNNFLRVYPKNTRIDSSNYKPLNGWMHGAQMVALNMQGYGKSLWLMHGMFRANGGCGYVKKPDFLMHENGFDPKMKLPVKKTLKVKIYMGDGWHLDFKQTHFDLYSPPDFYTRVGIAGVPADEAMKKTKTKEDQWTPVWEEEFQFPLSVPELALLRIEVNEYDMSEKDDFAGQTCLPVSELKPGIRTLPLYNRKGDKYSAARLLVRFDFA